MNALAAIALALDLKIPFATISHALANFKGIERRFSFKGIYKNAEIFDDYGHHPTEIYNTLLVARKRAKNKLIVAFQPHRYTRTYHLWQDFIDTFAQSEIDHLIITDIYGASENPIENITSERMVKELQELNPRCTISYTPYDYNFVEIQKTLDKLVDRDDLVLLLGAGRINKLADYLKN